MNKKKVTIKRKKNPLTTKSLDVLINIEDLVKNRRFPFALGLFQNTKFDSSWTKNEFINERLISLRVALEDIPYTNDEKTYIKYISSLIDVIDNYIKGELLQ